MCQQISTTEQHQRVFGCMVRRGGVVPLPNALGSCSFQLLILFNCLPTNLNFKLFSFAFVECTFMNERRAFVPSCSLSRLSIPDTCIGRTSSSFLRIFFSFFLFKKMSSIPCRHRCYEVFAFGAGSSSTLTWCLFCFLMPTATALTARKAMPSLGWIRSKRSMAPRP